MYPNQEQVLRAKIEAMNAANARANELYKQLEPIFRPLIGKKVLKMDGGLVAKVKNQFPKLENDSSLQIYRAYNLIWTVKANRQIGNSGTVTYETVSCMIGELMDGDTLVSIKEYTELPQYDYETIVKLRDEAIKAGEVYNTAKGKLGPFSYLV